MLNSGKKNARQKKKSNSCVVGNFCSQRNNLRLRVVCTLFCNLQSRVRTHALLVIGLHELLDQRSNSLSHTVPLIHIWKAIYNGTIKHADSSLGIITAIFCELFGAVLTHPYTTAYTL